jgi:HAD superfamily hydrolase (TIGR01459 family)
MLLSPPFITIDNLLANYDILLIDAFGVLMDAQSALPGAREFVDLLHQTNKKYYILTNGSKFTVEDTALSYRRRGLNIEAESIISSGSLIQSWVKNNNLVGANAYVIGPEVSYTLIKEAKLKVVDETCSQVEVVIITNQDEFPFLETMDKAMSLLFKQIQRGQLPHLLLPNPDIIYPASNHSFGFTSGIIAEMLESAMALRHPELNARFVRLGKPFAPIFEKARRLSPTGKMVMLGDQLQTDILGANQFGMDSVLLGSGVTDIQHHDFSSGPQPTYLLSSLTP